MSDPRDVERARAWGITNEHCDWRGEGAREMRERALHISKLALEGYYSPEDVAREIGALPDGPGEGQ